MSRFIKNEDGTVTDTKNNLTFKVLTSFVDVNHAAAKKAIEDLGEGWRMPSDVEAILIVDRSRYSPAVDTEFFPDIRSDWYWTDTECAWNKNAVWCVYFSYGFVSNDYRNGEACVLAVRSSQ